VKRKVDEVAVKIKKSIEAGKAILGFKEVVKDLRKNNIKEVMIASNTSSEHIEDLENLCSINDVPITKLKQANDELGVLCKKAFSVSVLAIKK